MPEVVSLWDQEDWKKIREEFKLEELIINQGDYGGLAVKPTTFANNLGMEPSTPRKHQVVKTGVQSSRELSRWAPGAMNMVASVVQREVLKRPIKIKALSWQEHLAFNHIPFRRDCYICQQAQQKQLPHRKIKNPLSGVLSLDTSGPFCKGTDLEGHARYILVGALTWIIPQKTDKLKEEEEDGCEVPEGAPLLEEEVQAEEQHLPELQGEDGEEDLLGIALGNAEEAPRDGVPEDHDFPKDEEEKEASEEKKPTDFEVRVYRIAMPMETKNSEEVMQTAMEMMLRLKTDGFAVQRVHVDQGREFMGRFRKWVKSKGLLLTTTAGDDPRANGRAEVAVQTIKSLVRRTLFQAGADESYWPMAVRYVSEVLRHQRIDRPPQFPPFFDKVQARKRKWSQNSWQPVIEEVQYLCPAWEHHGHWIRREGCKPTVIRYILRKTTAPISDATWIALEREVADMLTTRRRYRGKTAVQRLQLGGDFEEVQDEGPLSKEERHRAEEVLKNEMNRITLEEPEVASLEMKVVSKLRKLLEVPSEEEEILQTKIISPGEVSRDWNLWKPASQDEVDSLLFEKEALKKIDSRTFKAIEKDAKEKGKKVELIPSKLVFTKKPSAPPHRFKYKVRWVVCGNFEERKEGEENYSGGADAAAFRILIWMCSRLSWEASSIDIKTAFLNATMSNEDEEALVFVKPPSFFIEKGFMERDVVFQPLKAVYGFRRSPRLWGLHRDEVLSNIRISMEEGKTLLLCHLESEPHLWKVIEEGCDASKLEDLHGLVMTYVDDLFVAGSRLLVDLVLKEIQSVWTTSAPTAVSEAPSRFLGMEISKQTDKETGKVNWYIDQTSYIKDLVGRNEQFKVRQIPITKDQSSVMDEEKAEIASIREAQKAVGELLWTVTRSRPDLSYAVSRMGSMTLKNPQQVMQIYQQAVGYLRRTLGEGLLFRCDQGSEVQLQVFSDASFAPDDGRSHGCFIVKINEAPILWRSGRQGMMAMSTAECELMELIDAVAAGESVAVVLGELVKDFSKVGWCDNMATLAIIVNEGGNWRTRHLRMRSSFLKQLISQGEWLIQHVAGVDMVADIGTKVLSAARLQHLKKLLGMGQKGDEEGGVQDDQLVTVQPVDHLPEKKEVKEFSANIEGAQRILRLITLAASIQMSQGQGGDNEEQGEEDLMTFYMFVVVYTIFIIVIVHGIQWLSSFFQGRLCDKHQDKGDEGEQSEEEDTQESEEETSRPTFLPSSSLTTVSEDVKATSGGQDQGSQRSMQAEGGEKKKEVARPGGSVSQPSSSNSQTQHPGNPPATLTAMCPQNGAFSTSDFQIFKTKFGQVYHKSRSCHYLVRRTTGSAREYQWCPFCREKTSKDGTAQLPPKEVSIMTWGGLFHTSESCSHFSRSHILASCDACGK